MKLHPATAAFLEFKARQLAVEVAKTEVKRASFKIKTTAGDFVVSISKK